MNNSNVSVKDSPESIAKVRNSLIVITLALNSLVENARSCISFRVDLETTSSRSATLPVFRS